MPSLMIKVLSRIGIVFALLAGTFAAATLITVSATPTPVATLNAGSKQQFLASTAGGGVPVVYWSVSGSGCSGFGCGNITITGGLYSAPASLSSSILVTITATSTRDFTSTGSTTITVSPGGGVGGGTTVSISPPASLQLNAGGSETFSATVLGNANPNVTWSAGGAGCGGTCGTITSSGGVYTAPASLAWTLSVVITATSQATPSASASVTIQLTPVVAVTLVPFNPQMAPGTVQLFSANVTGSSIRAVMWSVTGGGTISSSGLYTAPSTVTSPLNVTVKATAEADTSKFATAALVVGPIVTISVSPSGLSLATNAQQQYSVSVTGAATTAVTWSVTGCTGACGSIGPISATTALYQAPSTIPSPATVNITAALAADSTKAGSAAVTIVPPSNSRLTVGQYAFLFRGFDASGPYQAAGSITSDGNGNITAGIEDINCGLGALDSICASGPVSSPSLTGIYTINADGRGTFTITPASGPAQTFSLAMNTANTKARFIESDSATSNIRGSGVLELQTPSAFTNASLNTAYAFNLSGVDSSGLPIAAIGNMAFFIQPFTLIPAIKSGVMDVNDNGKLSCYPQEEVLGSQLTSCTSAVPAFQLFGGTYNVGPNGRGTAQFSIQGFDGNIADLTTFNFSFYVISPGELFLLSMDQGLTGNPVFSGQALQRTLPSSSAFQPGLAVFSWSGSSVVPSGSVPGTLGTPQAAIGQVSIYDNTGDLTGFQYDLNSGGVVTWATDQGLCSTTAKKGKIVQTVPSGNCVYAVQPNLDILLSAGPPAGVFPNPVPVLRAFPISTNTAFVLGTGTAVRVGKMEPQSSGLPFPFMFGSDLMVSPTAPLISGTGKLTSSSTRTGPVTGNEDKSDISLSGGFMPNLPFTGYYANPTLPNGHAFMYFGSPGVPSLDFWVVSTNKTVAIDVDSGAVPNLIIFEQ